MVSHSFIRRFIYRLLRHCQQRQQPITIYHHRIWTGWGIYTPGPDFRKKTLWRIYDLKFVVTKLRRSYDEVVTILWSTYDF